MKKAEQINKILCNNNYHNRRKKKENDEKSALFSPFLKFLCQEWYHAEKFGIFFGPYEKYSAYKAICFYIRIFNHALCKKYIHVHSNTHYLETYREVTQICTRLSHLSRVWNGIESKYHKNKMIKKVTNKNKSNVNNVKLIGI